MVERIIRNDEVVSSILTRSTTVYNASASNQLAIFDLGEKNELRTEEGIAALQEDGTYSAAAHNDARAKAEELAGLFEGQRDQGAPIRNLYAVLRSTGELYTVKLIHHTDGA